MWFGLGGTMLTMLVVVPPWPIYNKHPEQWLPSGNAIGVMPAGDIVVTRKKVK